MTSAILQFASAAAVVVLAGTILTRCADAIADLTGMGRLLVGSVLLAAVTSLPEMCVDISAVRMGMADLAVGDLMGSSLCNLLILAILDLCHRSEGRMLSRLSAAHALSATVSMGLTSLACIALLLGPRLARFAVAGIGPGPIAILVAYALGVRLVFQDQRHSALHGAPRPQSVLLPAGRKLSLRKAVVGFAVSAGAILLAGPLLAHSAGTIADLSGLGGSFVGSTFVALATSLPELVTSLVAVRMGAFDLAVGNIFGSNAFNMLLLLPLDLVSPGPLLSSVSGVHAVTGLATVFITAVALSGQLFQVETRRFLIEPDATLVIALTLATYTLLFAIR
ncbi:MAG: sodium:calcium antiporter [Planctomycetes bacterium]|nr:sodium:calcium antiporter [Planctomycetota bacterium]